MGTQSSGSKVQYAVVGLGHIAQVAVLPAFKNARNSEIAALVSDDPRKRKSLGKKYRVAQVFSYEDYDQVLSWVDAVYLALPNHLHKEYAVRAAEAGVHVLCEKPRCSQYSFLLEITQRQVVESCSVVSPNVSWLEE